jgi:hypothetical protein
MSVDVTYVALRRVRVGGQYREAGELVPEAEGWRNRDAWIRGGYISAIPKEKVADELPAEDEGPSKTELYEQAQELEVEGRSSMDKDELAEAVEGREAELEQYHVGSGWYEVPGLDKKVRKAEALEYLNSEADDEE